MSPSHSALCLSPPTVHGAAAEQPASVHLRLRLGRPAVGRHHAQRGPTHHADHPLRRLLQEHVHAAGEQRLGDGGLLRGRTGGLAASSFLLVSVRNNLVTRKNVLSKISCLRFSFNIVINKLSDITHLKLWQKIKLPKMNVINFTFNNQHFWGFSSSEKLDFLEFITIRIFLGVCQWWCFMAQ